MKNRGKTGGAKGPRYAQGMEMDEIKQDATKEEQQEGNFTRVTKLVLDRTPDD